MEHRDTVRLDPREFAKESFALDGPIEFDRYAELRVLGYPSDRAAIIAFNLIGKNVDLSNLAAVALSLDVNPYVVRRVEDFTKSIDLSKLWNIRKAVVRLLSVVENPQSKELARIAATKELNVLMGVTITDEKGNTKAAGMTLADFYAGNRKDAPSFAEVMAKTYGAGTPEYAAAMAAAPKTKH